MFGLLAVLFGGGEERPEVATVPPPMPALENWNPGVRPPTIEEVIFDLIRSAEDTISTSTNPTVPTRTAVPRPSPAISPERPAAQPPVIHTPEPAPSEPLPLPVEPNANILTTALLKGALVNIICTPAQGHGLRGTSGTGVIIDARGIIVTVAHVGQHFLLEDYPEKDAGNCIIRTGSPAKNAYDAELIYLSSDWVEENPGTIISSNPKGTGENDFAFLAINRSLTGALPSSFPAVRLAPAGSSIESGDKVSIGSYGAEFLTSSEIRSALYPTITFGSIKETYDFSVPTNVDLFSVNAGAAAQQGSSGGGVLNDDNRFIGVITTRTVRSDLSLRDLQANTIDHVRRSFKSDTGKDLDAYLRGNLTTLIADYEDDAARLLKEVSDSF